MAGEVPVDALPYIDLGYDEPGVKQAALALVEEECRRYKPTKNYLEVFGPLNLHSFETEILKNEFQRMEQRLPMEMLSMKRYELPPPPPNKQSDATAWFECVENSYAQLEHQASRIINLELMSDYGPNTWIVYNQTLKTMLEQAEKQLEIIKKQIQNINLSRKTEQNESGLILRSLEQSWVGLVSKNYEIECALVELEKELLELKKKKSSQLVSVVNIGSSEPLDENPPALSSSSSSLSSSKQNETSENPVNNDTEMTENNDTEMTENKDTEMAENKDTEMAENDGETQIQNENEIEKENENEAENETETDKQN